MKAVILAAGQGTRIRSVHGERPKCLIEVGDQTILDHQLDALSMAGIDEVAIVVGYEKEQIIRHVGTRLDPAWSTIEFIENPVYSGTNNIYSLWCARKWLRNEGFICLNADVIFEPGILDAAIESTAPISMIVDPEWRDETMKVIIHNNLVVRMSKTITKDQCHGTYIGITTFRRQIHEGFFGKMEQLVDAGRVNEFFNVAVQELANEGVGVGFTTTGGLAWAEIDDPADLTFARQYIFPQLANRFAPPAGQYSMPNMAAY
jgi:choline kinase